ncbi:hypothetical protein DRH27_02975, partial [Candidatus Falkowbacteria bacterium]
MADPVVGLTGDISLASSAIAHIRSWTINKGSDNQSYATSDTGGYKKTAEGQKFWNGSADVYLDGGANPVFPVVGTKYASSIFTTVSGKTLTGDIRVDAVNNIECDIEGSGITSCTIEFTGDG